MRAKEKRRNEKSAGEVWPARDRRSKGKGKGIFLSLTFPFTSFSTPATQARRSPKDYRDYHIFKFAFYYSSYIRKVRNCNKRTKNPSKSLFSIDPYTYLAIQMMLTVNPVHLL